MPAESALIALIPEADVLVDGFRSRYDPSAAKGVPAHVTILYPFKPPSQLTSDVLQRLADLFGNSPCFDVSFAEMKRFPGSLYLAPTPDEPFRELTQRVVQRFPENPPYGGAFSEIVPHLTIADVDDPQMLDEIAKEFESAAAGRLPIHSQVTEVTLIDSSNGRWQIRLRCALLP